MAIKKGGGFIETEERDLPMKQGNAFPLDDGTTVHSLRLHKTRKAALEKYFKNKGMDLSNGLRSIIYEYMDQQGIK